jgi:hypothetical protein
LQKHYFGQFAQEGDEAHAECNAILCAIAATLDQHALCRRFVVQDLAEEFGVCLDVHGIRYVETDGSVGLEVAYLESTKAAMNPEIASVLDSAAPAAAPEMMAITAEPAAIKALLAELAAGTANLSEEDAARMQAVLPPAHTPLLVSRIALLKRAAPRPLLTKALVFRSKLDGWVAGKLKDWDTNPAFQRARKAQHATRELYQISLRAKSQANFISQLATLK